MAEEVFDIVNDDDVVIGHETRSVVHRTGLQHRGVHVFLFTSEGKLLIQKRNKDRHAYPSTLDCSVSEHVKAGEDYRTAARRGLMEELGLDGIELEPIITLQMDYGPNDREISRVYQGYLAERGDVHFNPGEVESVEYAAMEELRRGIEEGKRPFSRWFEQMLFWYWGKPSDMKILEEYGKLRPEAYAG